MQKPEIVVVASFVLEDGTRTPATLDLEELFEMLSEHGQTITLKSGVFIPTIAMLEPIGHQGIVN